MSVPLINYSLDGRYGLTVGAGDPSQTGSIDLRRGDAFALVNALPNDSIDLVLTSPPYWGHRTYGLKHNWDTLNLWTSEGKQPDNAPSYRWYCRAGGILGLEPLPDWYIAHLKEFFELLKPKLKASGSIWLNIGDTYFARWSSIRLNGRQGFGNNERIRRRTPMGGYRQEKQLLLIPARFAIAMQESRWILRNDLIWFKPNLPPRPEKDRLRLSHEHFFHFVKKPTEGRARYYYELKATEAGHHDVVTQSARAGSDGHSATFPEDIITPRILSSCPLGGVVLDPFAGTGRTLACAAQHGRHAIGFELSAEYFHSSNKRLSTGTGSPSSVGRK